MLELHRDSTGLPPLDHVLGGGLVAASVVLLASPVAIGKSTLALQMLAGLKRRCLYVTGEETREQVTATARRIGAVSSRLHVQAERNLAKIFEYARSIRAQTIAIDSIQTIFCEDVGGRVGGTTSRRTPGFSTIQARSHAAKPGSPTQIKGCVERLVQYAKTTDTAIWIVGHTTLAGDIAGPKTMVHDVDVVLELDKGTRFGGNERILKQTKNRFGSTNVVGHFELTDRGFVPIDAGGAECRVREKRS